MSTDRDSLLLHNRLARARAQERGHAGLGNEHPRTFDPNLTAEQETDRHLRFMNRNKRPTLVTGLGSTRRPTGPLTALKQGKGTLG